jgi:hypothetical protein
MNENRVTVDYIFYEAEMARAERHVKRWQIAFFAALAVAIIGIVGMYLEHKRTLDYLAKYDFETESYEYDLDTRNGGNANFIGGNGDINNGTSESTESSPQKNS